MASLSDPPEPTTARFLDAKSRIRRQAVASALALWAEIVNGPGDDTAAEWIDAWAPQRGAAAYSVSALTDAYLDAFLEAHGITPEGEIDPEDIVGRVRPGVPDEELAFRPLKQVRIALSEGAPLADAIDAGARRLESIEQTDVQQAFRVAFRERITQEPSIRAYRRVLVGAENCSYCVIASTQRYKSDRLAPIHPGCDCGVEPLTGDQIGQRVIDRDRLLQVKDLLREEGIRYGDRAEMANLTVRINVTSVDDVTEIQHGELGPLLANAKHRNTDTTDLAKWRRRSRREFDHTGRLVRG